MLVLPPAAASLDEADAAIELWEHYSRKTLDSTQRLTVQVMMAQGADGKWAAATTGREMPRQNGKGDEIEVVELWGLVQRAEAILHTVHDAVLLASQAQQRMLAVLDTPDLRRKVKKTWTGTGQQMIELRNGGAIWYRTRTGGGGRGVDDIARLVIDEAQHATEEHLAAVAPTMLANENPQLNAMGTAALLGKSDWWWSLRLRALKDDPGAFGWIGHTAERIYVDAADRVVQEAVDVADRSLWMSSNPAVYRNDGKDTMAFLEEQFLRLGPESFAREHLGVWDQIPSASEEAKINPTWWNSSHVPNAPNAPNEPVPGSFPIAFEVAPNGEWSSVAMAAGSLGSSYVELMKHDRGVAWLPEYLVERVLRWKPTAVGYVSAGASGAQVGAVLEAFRAAGIPPDVLHPVTMNEYRAACGAMFCAVRDGQLTHLIGQGPLDDAAAKAGERIYGDGFTWDGRKSATPIAPLVAVTLARALLPTEAEKPKPLFAY